MSIGLYTMKYFLKRNGQSFEIYVYYLLKQVFDKILLKNTKLLFKQVNKTLWHIFLE